LKLLRLTALALLLLLIAPCSGSRGGPQSSACKHFLPLTQGTYWVYRGTVRWFDPQKQHAVTSKVSLRMTIDRIIRKSDITVALITGFPSDLDWSDGQARPAQSLLIETDSHEIYRNALAPDFELASLESDFMKFDKQRAPENLLFRWPLQKGQKFGDQESLKRADNRYCWVIGSQGRKNLSAIQGVTEPSSDLFVLEYLTNPEDTRMELSPGIGIVRYQFHHHGSIADTTLELAEFHPGEGGPCAPGADR
jgi:hypothetical protein